MQRRERLHQQFKLRGRAPVVRHDETRVIANLAQAQQAFEDLEARVVDAFLFNHLFLDPIWLAEHRPNINERQARSIAGDIALRVAYIVRRLCAKLSYDLELHDNTPAKDLRSEQLAASYATTQKQATNFSRSPALYLWDVDDGFYAAAYLRALAFEASLREHLRVRYGRRWWATRKAGDELIDLWNTASRYTVEELSQQIGFGEISFELLAENLIAELQAD